MKTEEMTKTEQVEIEKWLNGDSIKYLTGAVDIPFDGREEEGAFTDEEYDHIIESHSETKEIMKGYEIDGDVDEIDKDYAEICDNYSFNMFFNYFVEVFEKKLALKKMTINYNAEIFS
jgi:hypothetical protein